MIKHIWSVFCSRSIIEGDSNNVSLITVLEELQLTPPPGGGAAAGVVGLRCELVILWSREPLEGAFGGRGRVRLLAPDKTELFSGSHTINLMQVPRLRNRNLF